MKTLVVLPTYNEAGTITEIVERSLASHPSVHTLVVDDNSPDGTGRLADAIAARDARVAVLHRPGKGGLGPAYLAGFAWALERDFEAIVEMDSDLSHDPADIARLIDALASNDVVIGSRYVRGGGTRNWSKRRELISRAGNLYARLLLRFHLSDATSGFRIYRRAVLETLPLHDIRSAGYGFQVEMAWRAWVLGFRVGEIPIIFSERREGASKMSERIVEEAAWRVLRWALKWERPPRESHPRSVARSA
jgi:dolichol-phosphate mannosyltransferase